MVVQYAYDEVTDAAGGLRDLAGTFHLVARGAGFDHAFGVAVHGLPAEVSGLVRVQRFDTALVMTDDASRPLADFITADDHGQTIARFDHLFPSTRRALPPLPGASFTNTSTAAPQVSPASVRIVVTFDQPIPRAPLGGSPYDPYLLVAHGTERYDIHLPGRHGFPDRPMHLPPESSGLTYVDARQYPWAMVVPFDWRFPLERVHINDGNAHTAAYPDFKAWRQSGGAQQADWYKRPNLTASTPRVADSLASGVRTRPWTLTAGH